MPQTDLPKPCFMRSLGSIILVILLGGSSVLLAQDSEKTTTGSLRSQIEKLERQMEEMSGELARLKRSLAAGDEAAAAEPAKPTPKADEKQIPAQNVKQTGVDLGTNLRLIPYGTIFFNAFGNSGGTNNTDDPLWAAAAGGTGQSNLSATVRQTRFGVRVEGAKIGRANLSAVVEADFFGGFPAIGVGENFGLVRLRLAYARISRENTSITLGQDWAIFAPNNPTSLAAAAIPQMAAAGNPWARLPQLRVERKFHQNRIIWQGALLAPQTGDFPAGINSPALLQPGSGAASRLPFFQTRAAYSDPNWFGTKKSGTIGLSAHYGRSRVTAGTPAVTESIDSAGVALDWNLPLAKRFGVTGEAFFGRNLAGFQAGIFQNYNPDFANRRGSLLVAGGIRPIGTGGGWMQVWLTPDVWRDRLTLYGSAGLDDPANKDLVSLSARDWRTRNLVFALNFIFKPVPQFAFGAEFRRLETTYTRSGRRTADHFNFAAAYTF